MYRVIGGGGRGGVERKLGNDYDTVSLTETSDQCQLICHNITQCHNLIGTIDQSSPLTIESLPPNSSSFHTLLRVLFNFPLQYFYAIGLTLIHNSLGWDVPPNLKLDSQATLLDDYEK